MVWVVTRCGEGRGNKTGFFKRYKPAFLRDILEREIMLKLSSNLKWVHREEAR